MGFKILAGALFVSLVVAVPINENGGEVEKRFFPGAFSGDDDGRDTPFPFSLPPFPKLPGGRPGLGKGPFGGLGGLRGGDDGGDDDSSPFPTLSLPSGFDFPFPLPTGRPFPFGGKGPFDGKGPFGGKGPFDGKSPFGGKGPGLGGLPGLGGSDDNDDDDASPFPGLGKGTGKSPGLPVFEGLGGRPTPTTDNDDDDDDAGLSFPTLSLPSGLDLPFPLPTGLHPIPGFGKGSGGKAPGLLGGLGGLGAGGAASSAAPTDLSSSFAGSAAAAAEAPEEGGQEEEYGEEDELEESAAPTVTGFATLEMPAPASTAAPTPTTGGDMASMPGMTMPAKFVRA
ncbi:hypothetical protein LTS18_001333 [Coniosporium uncinatum]|uniref:Uncharacterized protein n=1 Tax=Coniosporium uncinatum TaxID=93489 RepID=A0ACC3DUF1_9PEZI|nr:hypothetical protein LTS18_001333 [Coniosporium uncinatum]